MEEIMKMMDTIEFLSANLESLTNDAYSSEAGEDNTNIWNEINQINEQLSKLNLNLKDSMKEIIDNEIQIDKLKTSIENAKATIEILENDVLSSEAGEDRTNIYKEIEDLRKQIEEWENQLSKLPKSLDERNGKLKLSIENAERTIEMLEDDALSSEAGEDRTNIYKEIEDLRKQLEDWKSKLKNGLKLKEYVDKFRDDKNKDKEPEPKPDPKTGVTKIIEPEPEPKPDPKTGVTKIIEPEPEPNKLPIRSFWEIYNDTCTEPAGTIATIIRGCAHMPIFVPKNENIVKKVLSIPLIPFKVATKSVAILPNKILGTDKKFEQMRQNIENLSPEEFSVLVRSSNEANMRHKKHIKDEFDTDYLEPQLMKQGKVNNLYLSAVESRLGKENRAVIQLNKSMIKEIEKSMKYLEDVGRENWTKQQEKEYNKFGEDKKELEAEGKHAREELERVSDGAKKKSSEYRNISGWFLAKFNPDNREENAHMSELSKSRREAATVGDITTARMLTSEMDKYMSAQTVIKGTARSHIDVGKYSVQNSIEGLDAGEQTNGRLILTDLAIFTAVKGFFKQIKIHRENARIVAKHNEDIAKVNEANKNIDVDVHGKVSDLPGAKEAGYYYSKRNVSDSHYLQEVSDAYKGRNTYRDPEHVDFHMAEDATYSKIEGYEATGQFEAALNESSQWRQNIIQQVEPTINGNFDGPTYFKDISNAARSAVKNNGDPMKDFLLSDFDLSTTTSGIMANMLQGLNEGLDPTAIVLSAVNAFYQAQREGKGDFKRNLKINLNEQENQQNNGQENQQNNRQENNER